MTTTPPPRQPASQVDPESSAADAGSDVGVGIADAYGLAGQLIPLIWFREFLSRGLSEMLIESWQVEADSLDDAHLVGARLLRRQSWLKNKRQIALFELGKALVQIALTPGSVGELDVRIGAPTSTAAHEALERVRTLFPQFEPATREIPLTFWFFEKSSGAKSRTRRIEVPDWGSIAANYTHGTRQAIENLLKGFDPERAGQLLLWHGPPGTGKTYALRSLAWEWRDWAEAHYVMDPETLFGAEPAYLMEVLLDGDGHRSKDQKEMWKLLILEDTGEMLTPDAKARVGQGLSRLLNLADGVVGQGVRVLVLVTTNEPLEVMHPAVARPGRASSVVEFTEFSRQEAARWLEERDRSDLVDQLEPNPGIAELFALVHGAAPRRHKPRRAGFVITT